MDTLAIEILLRESIGLNVSSIGARTLKGAINKRISFLGLSDAEHYRNYLQTCKSEVNELIDEVTVNETWFFRDSEPFSAMASFAQSWRKEKHLAKLHILSLPCSTGEEPYSIAITLFEAGWNEYSFHIDAVDINSKVLHRAEEAVYNQNSFRGSDRYYSDKYFRKTGKHFVLKNTFKQTVQFRKGNLIGYTPLVPARQYEIIFCRNLLIYLDKTAQTNAIQTLDGLLAPGGLLFVGHAEAGVFAESKFTSSSYPKSFSLIRRTDLPKKNSQGEIKSMRQYPLFEHSSKPPIDSRMSLTHKPLFSSNEILEARYLLDIKEYEQAIKLCNNYVEKHGPSSLAYFLLGTIHHELMDTGEAVQLLRKAIYLDPENIEAMELLSSIFFDMKDEINFQQTKKRIQRVKSRITRKGHS